MKQSHLLSASAALLLMSCKPNFTGTYESSALQTVHKENKFAPEGKGFFKLKAKASYAEFAPFKVTLSKNGESYQGSVEFLRLQEQGMFGMSDDTSTIICNISSTSLSNDTLSFVFSTESSLTGSVNMKGFIAKKKGFYVIGIDRKLVEDSETPELNPLMVDKNSTVGVYKVDSLTSDMRKKSFERQRTAIAAELDSADKYDHPKLASTITYIDSVLLPQIKSSK